MNHASLFYPLNPDKEIEYFSLHSVLILKSEIYLISEWNFTESAGFNS